LTKSPAKIVRTTKYLFSKTDELGSNLVPVSGEVKFLSGSLNNFLVNFVTVT